MGLLDAIKRLLGFRSMEDEQKKYAALPLMERVLQAVKDTGGVLGGEIVEASISVGNCKTLGEINPRLSQQPLKIEVFYSNEKGPIKLAQKLNSKLIPLSDKDADTIIYVNLPNVATKRYVMYIENRPIYVTINYGNIFGYTPFGFGPPMPGPFGGSLSTYSLEKMPNGVQYFSHRFIIAKKAGLIGFKGDMIVPMTENLDNLWDHYVISIAYKATDETIKRLKKEYKKYLEFKAKGDKEGAIAYINKLIKSCPELASSH